MLFPTNQLIAGDLLVCGGTSSGVAIALSAAKRGLEVILIEQRTYLATEITATLDLVKPQSVINEYCVYFDIDAAHVTANADDAPAFHPGRLKTALEDQLLAAGVKLLYGLSPYAWRGCGDHLQVCVGGKFGIYSIRAGQCIDATESGCFGVAFGTHLASDERASHSLRIEFASVNRGQLATRKVQETPFGALDCHPGPGGIGHVFVDVICPALQTANQESVDRVLVAKARAAADWLQKNNPAFQHSRLVAIAEADRTIIDAMHASVDVETAKRALVRPGFWSLKVAVNSLPTLPTAIQQIQLGIDVACLAVCHRPIAIAGSGTLPKLYRSTDVLVVGGGTSGASAAMAAAENGARTILAEVNSGLGGIGTFGGINSYWFGNRAGHNVRLTRALRGLEPADSYETMPHWKMKMWSTEKKKKVLQEIADSAGVEILLGCVAIDAVVQDNEVKGAWLLTGKELIHVTSKVAIDASGEGDFAALAGVPYIYGAPRSHATMWFTLAPVLRPGALRSNFTSSVDVRDPRDYTRAILCGRRRGPAKAESDGHQEPYDHATHLGIREARHIAGEVTMTLRDQLQHRTWPDVIGVAYSNHDVKGYTESDWLRIGLIPPNLQIEIPYRSLVPLKVDRLLVTGKALSASSAALPAIRMQADFENLGFATGTAAAVAVVKGCRPRDLILNGIDDVQKRLVKVGNLPADFLSKQANGPAQKTMKELIKQLDDRRPLLEYQDMEMGMTHTEPIPFVEICCGDPNQAIPLLLREVDDASSPRRLLSAMALAWFEHPGGGKLLRERINELAVGATLPARGQPIRYAHPSPDQGNMPEIAYLLHALALTRDPESIPLLRIMVHKLDVSEAALRSSTAGLFDYVDAICDVAERLGEPKCDEFLSTLAKMELWKDKTTTAPYQSDWFEERKAFLEIVIARARARCGSNDGLVTLIKYLGDSRRPLVNHAWAELKRITGQDFEPIPMLWHDWINAVGTIRPLPWTGRCY